MSAHSGTVQPADHQLLTVRDLVTEFATDEGVIRAVDGVSFEVSSGETTAIVGESGCGKTVTALSVMRLVPDPPGRIVGGDIEFCGRQILALSMTEMMAIRGNEIGMVFQEPMTSLNPVFTIGDQIIEGIMLHQKVGPREARSRAIVMLDKVGIPSPDRRIDDYPHQLSGGMRQRAMIAMSLSCNPKLLIADEPTTALDVTVQAQILELMCDLRDEYGMAMMLITHDLGVVAQMAHRVIVMYAGQIVESAPAEQLFGRPAHPYTVGLLGSIPKLRERRRRLFAIDGMVPHPMNMPEGCRFRTRCMRAGDVCRCKTPSIRMISPNHEVRCHMAQAAEVC